MQRYHLIDVTWLWRQRQWGGWSEAARWLAASPEPAERLGEAAREHLIADLELLDREGVPFRDRPEDAYVLLKAHAWRASAGAGIPARRRDPRAAGPRPSSRG